MESYVVFANPIVVGSSILVMIHDDRLPIVDGSADSLVSP